jgi:hypothetical protein
MYWWKCDHDCWANPPSCMEPSCITCMATIKTGGSQYEGQNFMSIAQYDSHVVHMVEYRSDIDHKGTKRRGLLLVQFWNSTFLSLIMMETPAILAEYIYELILAYFSQRGLWRCQVRWSKVGQKMDQSDHMVWCLQSNELWHVRASVTTVTFELPIDGFGDKGLGSVNVQ